MTDLSDLQQFENDSSGELAAARLASLVTGLLERVEADSSLLHKDVAEAMGVTPGRVSQLMSGDGNLRVATLARLLDAFGYELSLTARPKSGAGAPVSVPAPPRRRRGKRAAVMPSRLRPTAWWRVSVTSWTSAARCQARSTADSFARSTRSSKSASWATTCSSVVAHLGRSWRPRRRDRVAAAQYLKHIQLRSIFMQGAHHERGNVPNGLCRASV